MNLNEHFEAFLEQLAGQSSHNRRLYRQRLDGFLERHGHSEPKAISPADVNAWLNVINDRGYAEATQSGYRQALKAFWTWLQREGKVDRSPADHVKVGNFTSRRIKRPPEHDVQACAAVAESWIQSSDSLWEIRDGAIFMLSMEGGPRSREICEIRLTDTRQTLDHGSDHNGIYQVRSTGKTKEVTILFTDRTAAGLRRWIQERPRLATIDRLFVTLRRTRWQDDPVLRHRPLTRSSIQKVFEHISDAAGLDKVILTHSLRHRLGDLATRQYGPKVAALLLNHKDASTAATAISFYHHPDDEDVSRAAAQLSHLLPPGVEIDKMKRLFGIGE